jgi:hypothetical protein
MVFRWWLSDTLAAVRSGRKTRQGRKANRQILDIPHNVEFLEDRTLLAAPIINPNQNFGVS